MGYTFYREQTGTKFEDQNLKCQNQACDRGGPFKLILSKSKFVDAQKIRVQESPEELRGGEQPQTLDVELEDDLAGRIFPGDRVIHQRNSQILPKINPPGRQKHLLRPIPQRKLH